MEAAAGDNMWARHCLQARPAMPRIPVSSAICSQGSAADRICEFVTDQILRKLLPAGRRFVSAQGDKNPRVRRHDYDVRYRKLAA